MEIEKKDDKVPCLECDTTEVPRVRFGEAPDYFHLTAWICRDCIEKALKIFAIPELAKAAEEHIRYLERGFPNNSFSYSGKEEGSDEQ